MPKKSIYSQITDGSVLWQIKYKPCIECETGRQVRKNGGDDSDVEQKIAQANGAAARQLKRCSTCKQEKPLASFGKNRTNKDGLQISCRECQAAIQKKYYQKLKGIKLNQTEHIDHVAPNIAPKAIAKQSIEQNAQEMQRDTIDHSADESNMVVDSRVGKERKCQICKGWYHAPPRDFTHEPNICDMCWESDQHMNTPIPPPPPVERITVGEAREIALSASQKRTCRNCGHQGPEPEFYKTGSQGYTNVCKACAKKKRAETIRRQAAAGVTPIVKLPESCVVLNFAEHPELLKTIRQAAKSNFRTVDNEIMFRVVSYEKPA